LFTAKRRRHRPPKVKRRRAGVRTARSLAEPEHRVVRGELTKFAAGRDARPSGIPKNERAGSTRVRQALQEEAADRGRSVLMSPFTDTAPLAV
jgi:hypothetical protein